MLDEKVIRRFSLNLTEKIQKDPTNLDMIWINEFSKELLKATLGEDYDFPINIDKVAKELGLDIIYNFLDNKDISLLHIMNGGILNPNLKIKQIITKERSTFDPLRRISIAYSLIQYLIHYRDHRFCNHYLTYRILENYTKIEDLWIEEISYLLLMPIDLTIEETKFYLKEESFTDKEVIKYMSIVAEIPKEKVPIIFNEIKKIQLLYQQNNKSQA